MKPDDFASGVLGRLSRKQNLDFSDVFSWREAWWDAWLNDVQEQRAVWEEKVSSARSEIAHFEQRLAAGRDYSTVIPSLEYGIQRTRPIVEFWDVLTAYLAADPSTQRSAAKTAADFADRSTRHHAWRLMFFYTPLQHPEDREYLHIYNAGRWAINDLDHNAGAFAVRMRRIANKGSASPLDSEEANRLLLLEHRYSLQCRLDGSLDHTAQDYAQTQVQLHCRKWIAIIDAIEHLHEASEIGDSSRIEDAKAECKTASALFGGNVDQSGNVIWLNRLTPEQRIEWLKWQEQQQNT